MPSRVCCHSRENGNGKSTSGEEENLNYMKTDTGNMAKMGQEQHKVYDGEPW